MDYVDRGRQILRELAAAEKHPAIGENVDDICAVLVGVSIAHDAYGNTPSGINLKRSFGDALFMLGYRAGQASVTEIPDAFKAEGESE